LNYSFDDKGIRYYKVIAVPPVKESLYDLGSDGIAKQIRNRVEIFSPGEQNPTGFREWLYCIIICNCSDLKPVCQFRQTEELFQQVGCNERRQLK
jgi:hypothetical protein